MESSTIRNESESWASSPGVRRSMQSNRPRDTKLELRVRSALHRSGLRFRKNVRPIPDIRCVADVVFPRERVAVFIDGCFWHSCPLHRTAPRSHGEWWRAKLEATMARDRANTHALEQAGWSVVRVWEHEPDDDIVTAVRERVVRSREHLSVGREDSH